MISYSIQLKTRCRIQFIQWACYEITPIPIQIIGPLSYNNIQVFILGGHYDLIFDFVCANNTSVYIFGLPYEGFPFLSFSIRTVFLFRHI